MTGLNALKRVLVLGAMIAAVMALTDLFTIDDAPFSANLDGENHGTSTADARASRIAKMAADWKGPVSFANAYAALDPLAAPSQNGTQEATAAANDGADPGAELVSIYCAACHSLEIVRQQKQSEAGWRYLLRWMEAEQGMAPLAAEDERQIIAYLSKNFGPE